MEAENHESAGAHDEPTYRRKNDELVEPLFVALPASPESAEDTVAGAPGADPRGKDTPGLLRAILGWFEGASARRRP